jgi:hypothetical protein
MLDRQVLVTRQDMYLELNNMALARDVYGSLTNPGI